MLRFKVKMNSRANIGCEQTKKKMNELIEGIIQNMFGYRKNIKPTIISWYYDIFMKYEKFTLSLYLVHWRINTHN